jgi:tetratricopeptide (TPR) repeat protein
MNAAGPAAPRLDLLRALLIIAAGFWVFAPALKGDWLMDDDFYLPQNALLHDPHRLWKIWFAPGSLIEYYPIEATLQAVQWHFWHMHMLGYHLTNVALHVLSALLLWRLLARFGLRYAWLGGLLFAVHPAVVESVAWIAEFKNVLSLPPFLLALILWVDFERDGRSRDYLLALGFFVVAMLCKISMALFPFVIFLYAWWKRGRVGWGDLKHALPFFAVSLVLGLMTVEAGAWFFQSRLQFHANPDIGRLAFRLALAGQSLAYYLTTVLWPVGLVPISPYQWPVHPESPLSFTPWLILAAALALFWSRRATWGRHALLGAGFFLIGLVPFIGLHSVTYMGFTWVMNHFLYLPMIGLVGLAVAAIDRMEARLSPRACRWLGALAGIALGLLAVESESSAGQFVGQQELWGYVVAHNPSSWLAHNNLGDVYMETSRTADAIGQFEEALRDKPDSVDAHTNLGFAYELTGHPQQAREQYEATLRLNPHYALAHAHLAHLLEQAGDIPEALAHYREAVAANPQDDVSRAALARLQNGKAAAPSTGE